MHDKRLDLFLQLCIIYQAYIFAELDEHLWQLIGVVASTSFKLVSYRRSSDSKVKFKTVDEAPSEIASQEGSYFQMLCQCK